MSTQPRLEARVSALERRQLNLETRVEEVAGDLTTDFKEFSKDTRANFKQLAEYHGRTEHEIYTRFDKIETTMATKEDINNIKTEIAAMETRILDAFKQLLATINSQRPPSE
jgi:uncharacterized protein Yka (UPF0111/DUF47 family)